MTETTEGCCSVAVHGFPTLLSHFHSLPLHLSPQIYSLGELHSPLMSYTVHEGMDGLGVMGLTTEGSRDRRAGLQGAEQNSRIGC